MRGLRPPDWLRRGLEGALIAGGVAIVSLLGIGLGSGGSGGPIVVLPSGPAGALLLAPAVLAIGTVAPTYPVAMAATRGDAVLGAIAAFLLAADACVILAGGPVTLERSGISLGAGLMSAVVSIVPAIAATIGGQLATPLGFGRRAGAVTATVGVVAGILALAIVAVVA
jgi:hypothetical protein